MEECKMINDQVKKMRANWDAQSSSQKSNKKGRFHKKEPDGDLHALESPAEAQKAATMKMLTDLVEKSVKKAFANAGKRKMDTAELHALNESVKMFSNMDITDETLKQMSENVSDSDSE